MEYVVNFTWDKEASVWIAQSDDIPGLVLEGGSLDALIERVRYAAPELIELNDAKYSPITNRNFTVDSKIKSRHTANAIMKQAGIDYHF